TEVADQMDLDLDDLEARVLRDRATNERIGVKFARWLARATAARRPAKWWLGVDHSDSANPDVSNDFVAALKGALRSNQKFTQVLLFLPGAERPEDALLGQYTMDDHLEGLMRSDVTNFVVSYAATIHYALRPEELTDITTQIASDWTGPFTPKQMKIVTTR